MSRQERSLSIPSSSRHHHHHHHNRNEGHRSGIIIQTYSRQSKTNQAAASSQQWHSERIQKGNLMIDQKIEPPRSKMSAKTKLQQKISGILNIFKINAGINEVTRSIMKEVDKYCDYRSDYNDTTNQPTNNKTTAITNVSTKTKPTQNSTKSASNPLTQAKPSAKVLNITPKTSKVATPKEIIDRVVEKAKRQGKSPPKIPRDLLYLLNSDGFVEKLPSKNKRISKAVSRYDDTEFEQQSTRPTRRSASARQSYNIVQQKTIEKKVVSRPNFNQFSSQTSVTKVKRIVHTVKTISASNVTQVCHAQAAPAPQVGNFVHKAIRVTHYPMIEIKAEPNQ